MDEGLRKNRPEASKLSWFPLGSQTHSFALARRNGVDEEAEGGTAVTMVEHGS
jgi:hypothetical protein